MAHEHAENVVGGILEPRYLLVGDELSPNVGFEDDLTGVTGSTSGVIAREFDSSTPFGDYVLTITDDENGKYAEIAIDADETVAGKRLILTAWARSDSETEDAIAWCIWQGLSGDAQEKQFVLDQTWRPVIIHEVVVPNDEAGEALTYRIYPFSKALSGTGANAAIRIDNVRVRLVQEHFTLPNTSRDNLQEGWMPVFQARAELSDRALRTVGKRMRYAYNGGYERLSAAEEVLRSRIMNHSGEIIFFPHRDAAVCYFVMWDEDYERTWAFGIAPAGHAASVFLKGTEVLPELPVDVVDETTEYEYPDDELYFESFGDSFADVVP